MKRALGNRRKIVCVIVLTMLLVLSGCSNSAQAVEYSKEDITDLSSSVTPISYNQLEQMVTYEENDSYQTFHSADATSISFNKNSITVEGNGAKAQESVVTITEAGTYSLSGVLTDGQVIVEAEKDSVVRLILNNVELTCSNNAPIYSKSSGKTIISLTSGTKNIITDGETYELDTSTDEPSAAIFSKDDLTVNGTGTLTINANYKDGIASKDNLKIMEGIINITAKDDGLIGRDLLAIHSGSITLNTSGDGMKSTNDEDETKGNLVIEDGKIMIHSGAKGIKAVSNLLFVNGTYDITAEDDSIHSNYNITFLDGNYQLATGDDGVHADHTLAIQDGNITISKSYEGLESSIMDILGGEISIVASDDGINTAGGNDDSSSGGNFGKDNFKTGNGAELNISGGTVYINSNADGIDSNGNVTMTDGKVYVSGPTSNGDGTLDYDGAFTISGGTLVAAGSKGMVQTISENSSQLAISMSFTSVQAAGTEVSLRNTSGDVIASFVPDKEYQNVVFSSPQLTKDSSYAIYVGKSKIVEFIISDVITYVNEEGITTKEAGNAQGKGGFDRGQGGRKGQLDSQIPPELPEENANGIAPPL